MLATLVGLAKIPENPVTGVYYANSLLPHKDLYSHMALYDGSGKRSSQGLPDIASLRGGAAPFAKDGITDAAVLKAWFHLACGNWSVYGQVAAQAKRTGAVGEQSKLLIDRVDAWLASEVKDIEGRSSLDIAGYMDAERVCKLIEGVPTMREAHKALLAKMQAAAKEDPLKSELTARTAYQRCLPMFMSVRKPDQDMAKSGFDQIAGRYGQTEFGRRAKSMLGTIAMANVK